MIRLRQSAPPRRSSTPRSSSRPHTSYSDYVRDVLNRRYSKVDTRPYTSGGQLETYDNHIQSYLVPIVWLPHVIVNIINNNVMFSNNMLIVYLTFNIILQTCSMCVCM